MYASGGTPSLRLRTCGEVRWKNSFGLRAIRWKKSDLFAFACGEAERRRAAVSDFL
jgi:hypothetical protein